MSHHAFIDESTRGSSYLVCAATITAGDVTVTRRAIQALRAPGQRRIHFTTESDKRRRNLLDQIATLEIVSILYVADHRNQVEARSAIIRHAARHLADRGVTRLVIEARQGQDDRDRADLYTALGPSPTLTYTHHSASAEPLLWVPDAVAWAWGRGGPWRKRVENLGLVADLHTITSP
jgi:hypothetical protein